MSTSRRTLLVCSLLLVVVTLLRIGVANPIQAIGYLYVIPISLAAVEFGVRGGALASAAAFALTVLWALLQHVPIDALGYGARAATFASISLIIGLQARQRQRLALERERLIEELRAIATRDQLTGLPNRRAWDERFDHELLSAARSGRPLSIAAIDLDDLKRVNDGLGHEEGDRLIRRCAAAWGAGLRETDFIARVGGDEFLMLLPDCSPDGAREVVQRVIDTAPDRSFSAGIATWDFVESGHALLRRADDAMYAAKEAGGARLALAPAIAAVS